MSKTNIFVQSSNTRELNMTNLSPQQLDTRDYAIINIFLLPFITLLGYTILMSRPGGQQTGLFSRFCISPLCGIWACALVAWGGTFARISVRMSSQCYISALISANITLAWLLLADPYALVERYVICILRSINLLLVITLHLEPPQSLSCRRKK